MKNKEKQFQFKTRNRDNIQLLRLGVLFLALVSFFTTANGMKSYIFVDNGVIAYLASAAIQGILLALGMNLPRYFVKFWEKKTKRLFIGKLILSIFVIILTLVTLFCSSCFSYVYIADVLHCDSWEADSKLLVQQTYRMKLYEGREYAQTYRSYLEKNLREKISILRTSSLSVPTIKFDSNWEQEKEDYLKKEKVADTMVTVINAMQNALRENASKGERKQAARAIEDAEANMKNQKDEVEKNIKEKQQELDYCTKQIKNLNGRIGKADDSDVKESLRKTRDQYEDSEKRTKEEKEKLEEERKQLNVAISSLQDYKSKLELANSDSYVFLQDKLNELQTEFFKEKNDEQQMLEIIKEIFEELGDDSSNMSLLEQLNEMSQNLKDYSRVKNIEIDLEDLIVRLRAPGSEREVDTSVEDTSNVKKDIVTNEDNLNSQWKTEWNDRLEELKFQISSLPSYSENNEIEDEKKDFLSDLQSDILLKYDQDKASKELDDITRRYISNHNAVYQGIIYLQSPYRSLAIFALLLALAFDLSGFVFGFVTLNDVSPTVESLDLEEYTGIDSASEAFSDNEKNQSKWSILSTLNQYVVLTGDYEMQDGIYYYKAFKNGLPYQWIVKDTTPYEQKIYIQEKSDEEWSRGFPCSVDGQKLLFAYQMNKPADGIYSNCQLIFDEGSLILVDSYSKEKGFIASVDEYVPIHSYNPSRGENRSISLKQLGVNGVDVEIAVVALNEKGTRVAAIYAIENG